MNDINDTYVLLGAYKRNITERIIPIWRKWSNIDFEMFMDVKNNQRYYIGYFGQPLIYNNGHIYIDKILDPNTFEVVIDDVFKLKTKTPWELYIKLDLMNLLVHNPS